MKKSIKIIVIILIIVLLIAFGIVFIKKQNTQSENNLEEKNAVANNSTKDEKIPYQNENYNIEYLKDWKLIGIVDEERVGPNSVYLGALEIEIPSENDNENTSSLYIKVLEEKMSLDEYKDKVRKDNTSSPSEYYEETNSSDVNFKNAKGFQITAEISDGEREYVKQDIFAAENEKIYKITFFGPKEDFAKNEQKINDFINNFEIL